MEPRRVRATEMLVPRRVKRRQGGRGGLAPRKCDGVGSSGMGVAYYVERSILGSLLGLGRTSGHRIGMGCGSLMRALERHFEGVDVS